MYYMYILRLSFPERNIVDAAFAIMRLTTFSDYNLRVLIFLAVNREELTTIPLIAATYGISRNHLMKVVHHLARTGIVESIRGKGGGIRLARSPEEIRLGPIIRSSEGVAPIVECLGDQRSTCRIAPACRLSGILVRAFEALYAVLDEYTLADLVDNPRSLSRLLKRA